ncbi:MAG: DNA-processing protein DprA [Flavobacteriaceae bacterium]|nr:DNA-processing protein DprA [Flavobacteriaceae bacterium]
MSAELEEIVYSIALRACPLVGDVNFMKLVSSTGSAKETWNLSKSMLREVSGIGTQISKEIGNDSYLDFAEKELKFCEKNNIKIRLRHLNQLPKLLMECSDAPAILYQKGDFDENRKLVSVVGTRKMTNYGRKFIAELMEQLEGKNITIVSGLALGTDACAHQEALNHSLPTIGVLAHGLHTIYPSAHSVMAREMIEKGGALLSEFNSNHKPDREHFLQRNRVVAGLSGLTIVVESAFGGGSMSTVSHANGYNREVFALPGRVSDKYSQGCNLIIAQHKARIISSFQDILDELGDDEPRQTQLFAPKEIELDENIKPIYRVIEENSPISLDDISLKLDIPAFKLLPILLDLELMGYIKSLSGRQYAIN